MSQDLFNSKYYFSCCCLLLSLYLSIRRKNIQLWIIFDYHEYLLEFHNVKIITKSFSCKTVSFEAFTLPWSDALLNLTDQLRVNSGDYYKIKQFSCKCGYLFSFKSKSDKTIVSDTAFHERKKTSLKLLTSHNKNIHFTIKSGYFHAIQWNETDTNDLTNVTHNVNAFYFLENEHSNIEFMVG